MKIINKLKQLPNQNGEAKVRTRPGQSVKLSVYSTGRSQEILVSRGKKGIQN